MAVFSGTLFKVTWQVYATVHLYTGQNTFLQGTRKTRSRLTGPPVYMNYVSNIFSEPFKQR